MTLGRLIAIIIIYAFASAGWIFLGGVTLIRGGQTDGRLASQVGQLWGTPLTQTAPTLTLLGSALDAEVTVLPAAAVIRVDLDLEHRRKGLIWYPTYTCDFRGEWTVTNDSTTPRRYSFKLALPDSQGTYDDFQVAIDDEPSPRLVDPGIGILENLDLAPGASRSIAVSYRSRGMETWRYVPGAHLGRVRGLDLQVRCNDVRIDFPDGSLSPTTAVDDQGRCAWQAKELITRKDIAVTMPEKLNPGPLVSRITFFAPVCLGFFFLVVAAITIVARIPIHPMHYLFIAAGFFAFHILLAYLVDVIDVHLAFPIASAVTLALVTSYLRTALGRAFPAVASFIAQAFFLILFSYSFFLEGTTGLTVAIGSVVTLAVLMRLTARLDWNEVFGGDGSASGATLHHS